MVGTTPIPRPGKLDQVVVDRAVAPRLAESGVLLGVHPCGDQRQWAAERR